MHGGEKRTCIGYGVQSHGQNNAECHEHSGSYTFSYGCHFHKIRFLSFLRLQYMLQQGKKTAKTESLPGRICLHGIRFAYLTTIQISDRAKNIFLNAMFLPETIFPIIISEISVKSRYVFSKAITESL